MRIEEEAERDGEARHHGRCVADAAMLCDMRGYAWCTMQMPCTCVNHPCTMCMCMCVCVSACACAAPDDAYEGAHVAAAIEQRSGDAAPEEAAVVVEAEHTLAAVPAVVCSVAGLQGAAAAATAAAAAADGRRRRGRAAPHAAPHAVAIVAVDQVGQTVQRLTSNEQLTHRRREGRDGLGGSAHDEITAAAHDSGEHQHRENRQAVDGEHQRAVKLREGAVRGGIGPAVGVDEDEIGEGDCEHGGAAGVLLTPPIGRDLW